MCICICVEAVRRCNRSKDDEFAIHYTETAFSHNSVSISHHTLDIGLMLYLSVCLGDEIGGKKTRKIVIKCT